MIKVEWIDGTTYVWVCKHHRVALEGGGHSVGLGIECWNGVSCETTNNDDKIWTPDSSELGCPRFEGTDKMSQEEYDRLAEQCSDSWTLMTEEQYERLISTGYVSAHNIKIERRWSASGETGVCVVVDGHIYPFGDITNFDSNFMQYITEKGVASTLYENPSLTLTEPKGMEGEETHGR